MHYLKNLLKLLIALLVLTIIGLTLVFFMMRSSIPTQGEQGKDADIFAESLKASVQHKAWARTGAIQWSMLHRKYLWDLRRGLVQVRYDDYIVMFDVERKKGIVKHKTREIAGNKVKTILDETYATWIRDVFILEPTHTLFHQGVKRFLIDKDSESPSLFVYYDQGGMFPKDSYQWYVNENGFPDRIKIWSQEYPTHGIPILLKKWKILKTGLKISTFRSIAFLSINIDVKADISLTHLIGRNDPFEVMQVSPFAATPTSQPNHFPGSDTIDLF